MSQEANNLINNLGLPRFHHITAEEVVPAVTHILQTSETELSLIETSVAAGAITWESFITPLEVLERKIDAVWEPIDHLLSVKNSPALRDAYNQVLGDIVAFRLRLSQSENLYQGYSMMMASSAWQTLNPVRQRAIELRIKWAKLAGIELKGEKKAQFNTISQTLSRLATEFSNNVLDATKSYTLVTTEKDEMAGLPDSFKAMAADAYNKRSRADTAPLASAADGPWLLTLEAAFYQPFMQYSARRDLREKLYRAYVTRAASGQYDNTARIDETLKLRRQLAGLLGFSSYAEYSLVSKMAQKVDAVDHLVEGLLAACVEPARKDHHDLLAFAASKGFFGPLMHWDVSYYAEALKQEKFDYSDEELRPYFPLAKVQEGLFALVNNLFGVTIKPADGEAETWHPDVHYFHLHDAADQLIAAFFLDPFSRPADKRPGAWMNQCLSPGEVGGHFQIPVAHLICNFTPPVDHTPSLLTFREVVTLFHEFGHGLHHMLTEVKVWDVSGIRGVEWDAVELPSQFMENWCYHKETLKKISGHYQTGEPIPDALYDKIVAAKNYRAASDMCRQLHFAAIDMELHHRHTAGAGISVFAVNQQIAKRIMVLPPLEEDRFLCSFSHIFAGGYAAGYYSSKWAEVLSADAFSAFEEIDMRDPAALRHVGLHFRESILAKGGGSCPTVLFRQFRGRDPQVTALLRHYGLTAGTQTS